jgi:signal transduction histidine kinase
MKLLNKVIIYYVIVSMILFTTGGFIFYNIAKVIVIRQITETLTTERNIIEKQILAADSLPDFSNMFGHRIDIAYYNQPLKASQKISDTLLKNPAGGPSLPFRYIYVTGAYSDNRGYYRGYSIELYKSVLETQKLIFNLFLLIWIALISLLAILSAINLWISKRLWGPFFTILSRLAGYNINEQLQLNLSPSGIREFDQLNSALNAMSERIRTDFINLKEFTEDISHEIHTPLSIIKSKLELLFQSKNLTEEQFKNIHSIYEAVNRLSRMNNSLLLITRIQNQQFPDVKEINLSSLIEKFLENFKELFQQKNISITTELNRLTTLQINPDLAEIMISNLLGNALKHNIQNGTISIVLNEHQLIIKNTGHPGTTEPSRLFNRFKKGHSSTDSPGLGLSIVRKIVVPYAIAIDYSIQENFHTLQLQF